MSNEGSSDHHQRNPEPLCDGDGLFVEMANGLPLIVWVHDAAGEQVMVNDTFCEFFGVSREEMKGGRWQALVHPESGAAYVSEFRASVREQRPFHGEVQVRRADGEWRWLESWARPRFGASGEFQGMMGTSADVTERKRAEEVLRITSERDRFRADLTDALRPLARPVEIQAAASRALGEHLGASRVLYTEITADAEYACVDADYHDGVESIVGRHRLHDFGTGVVEAVGAGRTLVVADVAQDPRLSQSARDASARLELGAYVLAPLFKQGRTVALFVVHHARPHAWTDDELALIEEVAERTWSSVERARSEAALRQSEARYRTLFESIDQGFCVIEVLFDDEGKPVDHRFLETNPAFERHTGFVDAVGKRARELEPDLETIWYERYGHVAVTGEPLRFVQGSEVMGRWFEVAASRVGQPEEHKVALLFTDISERKRAEDELRASEERLRESDRRKDEFLAMLGHELRNPLAAIQSATELVKLIKRDDSRLERVSDVLARQSSHMARLIEGLLEVSRIARGKINLERQTLDLREVVAGVLEDRATQVAERGLELTSELSPEPVWVYADRVRLAQILDNLLGNALKFTPPGGTVTVQFERDDGRAVVRVRDTGIGIRPERLARIFEPFHQEEQDVARGSGGLGLGLALARGLVELHHGTLEAHSEGAGSGTCFEVRLPLTSTPQDVEQTADVHAVALRKILIVEDNPDAAQMLCELLELRGHEVSIARSGPEGLAALRREAWDLVLCDIGLPGMSGYEFARAVRADTALRGLTLVALTGYGQPEDRARTAQAGFDAHLTKPVDLDALDEVTQRLPRSPASPGSAPLDLHGE